MLKTQSSLRPVHIPALIRRTSFSNIEDAATIRILAIFPVHCKVREREQFLVEDVAIRKVSLINAMSACSEQTRSWTRSRLCTLEVPTLCSDYILLAFRNHMTFSRKAAEGELGWRFCTKRRFPFLAEGWDIEGLKDYHAAYSNHSAGLLAYVTFNFDVCLFVKISKPFAGCEYLVDWTWHIWLGRTTYVAKRLHFHFKIWQQQIRRIFSLQTIQDFSSKIFKQFLIPFLVEKELSKV